MGGFLSTIGRMLGMGGRPDPRMVRTPPFLRGPENDPANVSGWGPGPLDRITQGALDAQWRGAPIMGSPQTPPFRSPLAAQPEGTTPSLVSGDRTLAAAGTPAAETSRLAQPAPPSAPPPTLQRPLTPPPMPEPAVTRLADLPPQHVTDREQDYTQQRSMIKQMPHQGDYAPGKARTALSMITGLAGNVAATNPFSWVGRAAAPTIQQASGMIRDRGYNKAMQRYKEDQAMADAMAGTSQTQLTLDDKLATGQAGRDYKDVIAENAKLKSEAAKQKIEQDMVELTPEQAKLFGLEESYNAHKEAGQPLKMHRSIVKAEVDRAKANEVQQQRSESYEKVKGDHDKAWKDIEKGRNDSREAIAKLTAESRERVATGQNTSREKAAGIRASASRANTLDTIRSREQIEKSKFRAEKLKQDALQKITAQRDKELAAAQYLLGKDAQGNPRTPEQVLKAAQEGDASAARAHADWMSRKNEAYAESVQKYEQLEKAYQGMIGIQESDDDEAPSPAPVRKSGAPKPVATNPAAAFDRKK